MIINKIQFPQFTGIKCSMMPFIQGDAKSLPKIYQPYAEIINQHYLEKGKMGLLTIDESFVQSGKSQRGFNSKGIKRNVHIEVGHDGDITAWGNIGWGPQPSIGWGSPAPNIGWGGGTSWGGHRNVLLHPDTQVLIANSISDTCMLWDRKELRPTNDGDLADYIDDYPEGSGIMMKAGDLAKISIFTPHECIAQHHSSHRQFIRIVGEGVTGREEYFTINPLMEKAA